jgi:hypothetical protein
MSHWWCCCGALGPCEECSDDFTRADSGNLGTATCLAATNGIWLEPAGDWSISGNSLVEAGTTGAVAVISPLVGRGGHVEFEAWPNVGDRYRAILNYADIDNYHFAEWEFAGAGAYTIRLYRRRLGVETLLLEEITTEASWQPDESYWFEACITSYWFVAYGIPVEGSPVWTCNVELIPAGNAAGVGNGAATPLTIDSFAYYEAYSKTRVDCPECVCTCQHYCLPMTLQATIEAISGCPNLDGLQFDLTWRSSGRWRSVGGGGETCGPDDVLFCSYGDGIEICYMVELDCTGVAGGPENFLLYADFVTDYSANENSTCDPLYLEWILVFGTDPNFADGCTPGDCDAAGTVRLMITEKP